MEPEANTPADSDDLSGIPYIGEARKVMLLSHDITTRAHLATLTQEELMKAARMSRVQAIAVLACVAPACTECTAATEQSATAAENVSDEKPKKKARLQTRAAASLSRLKNALTSVVPATKSPVAKSVERCHSFVNGAVIEPSMKPRVLRKLSRRLERVAIRLEQVAAKPPKKEKPLRRLRDYLNRQRRQVQVLLPRQKSVVA